MEGREVEEGLSGRASLNKAAPRTLQQQQLGPTSAESFPCSWCAGFAAGSPQAAEATE